MLCTIRHETFCHFDSPVSYSIRKLRITPREEAGVRIAHWNVTTPVRSNRSTDAWGNTIHMLALTEAHEDIRIVVDGTVELPDSEGPVVLDSEGEALSPSIYLTPTRLTQAEGGLGGFARERLKDGADIAAVLELSEALARRVVSAAASQESVGAAESFARGRASPVDQAHLLIAACRAAGLPARFVCGYRFGEQLEESCWADVWLEESGGWVGFDTRSARLASARQIRLAVGRDYLDACPMRSVHQGGGREEVSVSLRADRPIEAAKAEPLAAAQTFSPGECPST